MQKEGEKGQWLGRLKKQRIGELRESRRQQKGETGAEDKRFRALGNCEENGAEEGREAGREAGRRGRT